MKSWMTLVAVAALALGACSGGANVSDVAACQHDLGAAEAQATACKLAQASTESKLSALQEKVASLQNELAATKVALAKRGEPEPAVAAAPPAPAAEAKHAAAPAKDAPASAKPAVAAASPAPAAPAAPAPRNGITLGFAQLGTSNAWRVANNQSIKDAAAQEGIRLKFVDAQQSAENQIKALRSFIAQKVDVIAISPVVESGWDAVLREAKAAGIPVIVTDGSVDAKDQSLWVTKLGSDFAEEGRRAARWLVEAMKGKGEVRVVELTGTPGSAPAVDRKRGFEEILKEHPEFKIVRSESGEWTREKGKQVTESILAAEGNKVQVLFAHNDDMALGAIEAIEAAGLKPSKDVVIVSVDGVKAAFEAMAAGKLNATVECSPLVGPQLMAAVKQLAAGKPVPKRIVTKEGVFPAEVALKELPNRKY